MSKSTKVTVAQRVHDVTRLMIAGAASFADVRQFATNHEWRVSDRQLRRYIEKAWAQMAEATNQKLVEFLALQLAQRRALYARAFKEGNLALCQKILKDDAELLGLYPSGKSVPLPLVKQTPADQLSLRSLSADERNDYFEEKFKERYWDELRKIRWELLERPDILDVLRERAMEQDNASSRSGPPPGG